MTCAPSHFGRPREHNREKIAQDLIEWAKKDDSLNLNKFCAYYEPIIPPSKITLWAKEDDNFREAYESAKSFIGFRREEKLNKQELHVKAYDLNATTYDYFLKEERMQQAKYESLLKSQEQMTMNEADTKKLDAFVNQVRDAQALSSTRKMDESKSNAEQKS